MSRVGTASVQQQVVALPAATSAASPATGKMPVGSVAGETPATPTSTALETEKVAEPHKCVEIAFGLDD